MVQVNNTPIVLRVKFKKVGKLQYISHLDLVRTMHKTVVRSKLPLWYTEGFNPKPKMVFAAPLSIGTESQCEYMDIRLTEKISAEEAIARLNSNMTSEMQVTEAYYPTSKLTELKWMSYTITLSTDNVSEALANKCEDFLLGERVEIQKKTKSADLALVDIRPLIKSVSAVVDENAIRLSCVLSADQSAFLNPEYLVKALREKVGILNNPDLTSEYYTIMREKAYTSDMQDFR